MSPHTNIPFLIQKPDLYLSKPTQKHPSSLDFAKGRFWCSATANHPSFLGASHRLTMGRPGLENENTSFPHPIRCVCLPVSPMHCPVFPDAFEGSLPPTTAAPVAATALAAAATRRKGGVKGPTARPIPSMAVAWWSWVWDP